MDFIISDVECETDHQDRQARGFGLPTMREIPSHYHISTLRVTSPAWSGIMLYSGMASGTVLSSGGAGSRKDCVPGQENTKPTEPPGEEEVQPDTSPSPPRPIEADGCDFRNAETKRRYLLSPSVLQMHESSAVERELALRSSISTPLTSYSIFNKDGMPVQRPQTSGPRIVVTPTHSGPAGLTVNDVVKGTQLRATKPGSAHEDQEPDGNYDYNALGSPEPVIASSKTKQQQQEQYDLLISKKSSFHAMTPVRTTACRIDGRPSRIQHNVKPTHPGSSSNQSLLRPSTTPSEREVSLELTITSLDPPRATDCSSNHESEGADDLTPSAPNVGCVETSRRYRSGTESHPVEGFCEVRHKERAKSAPAVSDVHHGASPSADKRWRTEDDGKRKFSNIYWRARSAYHKRQMDINLTGDNNTGNSGIEEASVQLKGSLLRPLLYTEQGGVMRHSAGCPYKCKSCFKACLVSEEYINETMSRAAQNNRVASQTRGQRRYLIKPRPPSRQSRAPSDPREITRRALARSQALFKTVYGDKNIRSWPTRQWVDLRKEQETRSGDKDAADT